MRLEGWLQGLKRDAYGPQLAFLYGPDAPGQRARYLEAARAFEEAFRPAGPVLCISAPGRAELCGNHTDHQGGHVLAAAVTLDMVAFLAPRQDGQVRLLSRGYGMTLVKLDALEPRQEERGTPQALIRGIEASLRTSGYRTGGFDAYVDARVPIGGGLSSSAALEILLGSAFNYLYNEGSISGVALAKAGQFAENHYFGKPCGLMDQLAASTGGVVALDFADMERPGVTALSWDVDGMGYGLYAVETGGSHQDLTEEYAAIPREMGGVAACFGKARLCQVQAAEFYACLGRLRGRVSDRALLRAMHFFREDQRVQTMAQAIRQADMETCLACMRASGASSMSRLQNVYPLASPGERSLALALALSEEILGSQGAWRLQGGGFAGTIQALVPRELCPIYVERMEAAFGPGCCRRLHIRPVGGYRMKEEKHG